MIVRYSVKDAPVPEGWRFELLKNHYAPERGYGLLIREPEKEQILIAVYPNSVLLTINGKCHRKKMTKKQMLNLAQKLIETANE
jgi:hypothetical protein